MSTSFVSAFALAAMLATPALAATPTDANTPAGQDAGAAQGGQAGAQVHVQQPAPQVSVQQPAPQVTVQQPQPQVTVTQPKPEVTVTTPKPQVTGHEAQPNVTVQKTGQPEVNVQQSGQPDVNVVRPNGQANAGPGDNAANTGTTTGANPVTMPGNQASDTAGNPLYGMTAGELKGKTLHGDDGKAIGDIDRIVMHPGQPGPFAVVGVGGFLGLGERDVAVPFSDIRMGQDHRLTASMTKDQVKNMQAYNKNDYKEASGNTRLGDTAAASR